MRIAPLIFVGAAGLSLVVVADPASAESSASDCVSVRSTELSTGLAFDIQNTCDKRLSCALTWTLTCENASGKATSKAAQQASFIVAGADTHPLTASSAACKDGWRIDDIAWTCSAAGK
jgi:hypothetical protein